MKRHLLLLNILLLSTVLQAQVEISTELYKSIKEKDSLLFNHGFNNCDITQFHNLISDNFEFYHDQSGITNTKEEFIERIENGLCKLPYKAKRVLDENSLEIYPLMNNGDLYGAIESGIHSFYAIEKNKKEYLTSVAKFSHVWLLEKGIWKLSRVLSYDHKTVDKPIDNELLFKDKNTTERWLKQKNIPALGIGYIEDGKIKQVSVFGELEGGVGATKNTIWNVASLTKPVTAMITLKLIDQGLLGLDEFLFPFYLDPDIKDDPYAKKLTPRIILSHQTGFSNWRGDNENKKLRFEFEPGTKYQYSSEGYEYLRKAIEHKLNKKLEQLANELIFEPLQMNDTKFVWDDSIDSTRFAKWHTESGERYVTYKHPVANAADDLLTTVEDYSKFLTYVINGAGLSGKIYAEMTADQVRVNELKHFGLGWWIDENINDKGDFALVHGGDDIGVHCIVFMIPNTKKGLLIFTNSDNGTNAYFQTVQHFLKEDAKGIFEAEMR